MSAGLLLLVHLLMRHASLLYLLPNVVTFTDSSSILRSDQKYGINGRKRQHKTMIYRSLSDEENDPLDTFATDPVEEPLNDSSSLTENEIDELGFGNDGGDESRYEDGYENEDGGDNEDKNGDNDVDTSENDTYSGGDNDNDNDNAATDFSIVAPYPPMDNEFINTDAPIHNNRVWDPTNSSANEEKPEELSIDGPDEEASPPPGNEEGSTEEDGVIAETIKEEDEEEINDTEEYFNGDDGSDGGDNMTDEGFDEGDIEDGGSNANLNEKGTINIEEPPNSIIDGADGSDIIGGGDLIGGSDGGEIFDETGKGDEGDRSDGGDVNVDMNGGEDLNGAGDGGDMDGGDDTDLPSSSELTNNNLNGENEEILLGGNDGGNQGDVGELKPPIDDPFVDNTNTEMPLSFNMVDETVSPVMVPILKYTSSPSPSINPIMTVNNDDISNNDNLSNDDTGDDEIAQKQDNYEDSVFFGDDDLNDRLPNPPTEVPLNPPMAVYIPPPDDTTDEGNSNAANWNEKYESFEQMTHDRNVIAVLSTLFGFMLIFSIFVAHQMLNNPDGCCASICRILTRCTCCVMNAVCSPCKMVCGSKGYSHSQMINDSNTFASHDLDLT